jgi:hypothetical protein
MKFMIGKVKKFHTNTKITKIENFEKLRISKFQNLKYSDFPHTLKVKKILETNKIIYKILAGP